jgi:hypothetical protein
VEEEARLKLTPRDYRRIRLGLNLVFWGLIYFALVCNLIATVVLAIAIPFLSIGIRIIGHAIVIFGLAYLIPLRVGSPFRGLLLLSMFGVAAASAAETAGVLFELPVFVSMGLGTPMGIAALLFVFALRILMDRSHWVGVRRNLNMDVWLISILWIGWDVVAVVLMLFAEPTGLILLFLLSIFLAHLVAICHLWMTVAEIHRTARLRRAVAARKKKKPLHGR